MEFLNRDDVLLHILSYLEAVDIFQLLLTSKYFHASLRNIEVKLWKLFINRDKLVQIQFPVSNSLKQEQDYEKLKLILKISDKEFYLLFRQFSFPLIGLFQIKPLSLEYKYCRGGIITSSIEKDAVIFQGIHLDGIPNGFLMKMFFPSSSKFLHFQILQNVNSIFESECELPLVPTSTINHIGSFSGVEEFSSLYPGMILSVGRLLSIPTLNPSNSIFLSPILPIRYPNIFTSFTPTTSPSPLTLVSEVVSLVSGLRFGSYGPHGKELLQFFACHQSDIYHSPFPTIEPLPEPITSSSSSSSFALEWVLVGLKLYGDPNVPGNKLSCCLSLSEIYSSSDNWAGIDPSFDPLSLHRPLICIIGGFGQINLHPGAWNPQWVPVYLIVYRPSLVDNNDIIAPIFSLFWRDAPHVIHYFPWTL